MPIIRRLARAVRAFINSPGLHRRLAAPFVSRARGGEIQSILVIRPDNLGDFVLGIPLLEAIAKAYPEAALHVAVAPFLAEFARGCPWIATVVELPADIGCWCPAPQTPVKRLPRLLRFACRVLRPLRPDLAILPRVDTDGYGGGQLLLFSGAPRRIGFSETTTRERATSNRGFDAYLTDVVTVQEPLHEVEASRALAASLGIQYADWTLSVWATESQRLEVARRLAQAGLQDRRFVALAPGATAAHRRWPASRFATVCRALVDRGLAIVTVGSDADTAASQTILADLPPGSYLDTTGQLSLAETACLLQRAQVFVGNDSGPMHLAAAAGTPCVEISSFPRGGDPAHHNSPKRFGPWGVPCRILQPESAQHPCRGSCSAAEPHCIAAIEPGGVIEAVQELLDTTPHAGRDAVHDPGPHAR